MTAEVERLRAASKQDEVWVLLDFLHQKQNTNLLFRPEGRTPFSNRTTLKEILAREDEGAGLVNHSFIVAGWVRTIRLAQKNTMAFVNINDGSTFRSLQIVVDNDVPGFSDLEKTEANTGASFWAKGKYVQIFLLRD